MDRRTFLTGMVATGAGLALAACGGDDKADAPTQPTGGAGPSGSSTNRAVKLGFIALTDCASILMAKELGYFAERGVDVTIEKQASWPATRDNLLTDQIDGCHGLYTLPLSVATGIGGDRRRDIFVAMMLNNNGQAITLGKKYEKAGYADLGAAKDALLGGGTPELAMTFPGGTHDLWLRYWLKAAGIPFDKVGIKAVPPAQMVQNMGVGNVSGYCVGEPWGAVAVRQKIGFTHLATQDLWLNHPEKAFLVTKKFKEERPDVVKDCIAAILKASKWLDDFGNRQHAAEVIGAEKYINAPAAEIGGRLGGVYDLGADLGTKDFAGNQMRFYRDGLTNLPRKSHYIWAMAQYQRFGLLTEAPPYQELADELLLTDLYREAAALEGVAVPDDDMQPFEVALDKVTFDPKDPAAEVARDDPEHPAGDEDEDPKLTAAPVDEPVSSLVLGRSAEGPPADHSEVPAMPTPPPGVLPESRLRRIVVSVALGAVGFALLIAVWQLGSSKVPNLPPPGDTFTKLKELLSDPFYDRGPNDKGIALRMLTSLRLVFTGFSLAVAVGVPIGLAIGASKRAWQMFNPVIQLLRPVSPLAWFPIWLVVFSDSGRAAYWVIFITSLWPTVLSTAAAAAAIPSDQRVVAKVFQFGKVAYLRHVLVPNALPSIVTGMRVSMGIAWMVIVAVEMLSTGGGAGIGAYVWEQYNALNLPSMIAAIVLIGVVGFALDLIFLRLAKAVAIEEPAP